MMYQALKKTWIARSLFFFTTFFSISTLSASPCWRPVPICEQTDWGICNGAFEFGVDFLWWKPCVDDLDYAALYDVSEEGEEEITTKRTVKYASICPNWEPGVRFYFRMPEFYCDWNLMVSYTYIESDHSAKAKLKGDLTTTHGLTTPLGYPNSGGTLHSKICGEWDLSYHDWDILFGTNLSSNYCYEFVPFFGVAGVDFDFDFNVKFYEGTKACKIKWDGDYYGIGFRFGTEYVYHTRCLTFFTKAHGSIIAGEADGKIKQNYGNCETVKDNGCCHFIPGYHISAGVLMDTSICDFDFSARVGYEFVNWFNLPNHRIFSGTEGVGSEVGHSTSPTTRHLGFHGLFAGFSMTF